MKTVSLMKEKDSFIENLKKQIGSVPNKGDSVEQVREIRKKLSKHCRNMTDEEFLHFVNGS